MAALAHVPTISRLVLVNAAVLAVVFVLLAVTPAPVTFPADEWEAAFLLKGAAILLAANVLAVHVGSAAGPRRRRGRRAEMAAEPLLDLRELEHFEVAAPDGVIGVVDEALGDRDGRPLALVVCDGWFGARRFLLPLDDVVEVDRVQRRVMVRDGGPARDGAGPARAG